MPQAEVVEVDVVDHNQFLQELEFLVMLTTAVAVAVALIIQVLDVVVQAVKVLY